MSRAPSLLFFILTVGAHGLRAQMVPSVNPDKTATLFAAEADRYRHMRDRAASTQSDSSIDVTYYKLNLTISTSPNYLRGIVTVKAVSKVQSLTVITLDLMSTMTVDSVRVAGTRVLFSQFINAISINLNRSYGEGELVTLDLYYEGLPVATGFGSFEFGSHAGMPWVWSLSEPYGARDWWPCKDTPLDKADSVDVWVTCNSAFKVGSNGRLVAVIDNGDGTATHQWAERYPISTYLVSIALTNYAEFSNWFHYSPTDSMQVLNYVLPEHLATALDSLPKTVDALRILSGLYGLYPFIREKYGHSEFGLGGAMEHQTMTSTTGFGEFVVVHELAHQWFGDMITCATWQNIWLNEGFARYSEALYAEARYGANAYRDYMSFQADGARTAIGPVYSRDTSDIPVLFNDALTYRKGAMVLHMLRHVLGDSVFFRCMRNYANDPRFRFNVATTEGFQSVCESTSGLSLGYFFNEWVFGEKYPHYAYAWTATPSGSGFEVSITIGQTTGTTNPAIFSMPIDFKLSAAGWDTTVVLFNTSNEQQFRVPLSHRPDSVLLDPGEWILHDIVNSLIPTQYILEQNYPNPFNTSTRISYSVFPTGTRQAVSLKVYDVLGREVATLVNTEQVPGTYQTTFDGSGLASGVYFYRLQAGGFAETKKLLLLK